MKIVLLGPPGAGKGTQAALITEKFSLKHISTGDIFRANIKARTPLGIEALRYIDDGKLVPDELTVKIVEDTISGLDNFMLDGFPRTVNQAEQLEKLTAIDCVINIAVDNAKLMGRITGRRVCPVCKATYHVKSLQGKETCQCGERLVQRADDTPETVEKRLKVYEEQTAPLTDFYTKLNRIVTVDGDRDVDVVFADISEALERIK